MLAIINDELNDWHIKFERTRAPTRPLRRLANSATIDEEEEEEEAEIQEAAANAVVRRPKRQI